MTLAVLLLEQPGPPSQQLNISQLTAPGGSVVSTVIRPQAAAPTPGQQLPALQLEVEPQVGTGSFDVQVVGGDLRLLLATVAANFGLNLLMDEEITATLSINLINVTLEEALQLILEPRGLEYRVEGDILRVQQPQLETRTFEFDYITTIRTLSRSTSASASAGGAGGFTGGGGTSFGGGGGGSNVSLSGQEANSLLDDVEADLGSLISPEGQIIYNRIAGLIFATDLRQNLDAIGNYLELIQNAVNRQVVIEARIVEVKLNDNFQAGIDWSAVLGNTGTITQSLGGAALSGFTFNVSRTNFDALLNILSTRGEVNVLTASSVATLNNQPAVIRVGTQDVFFTTTSQVDPQTGRIIQTTTTPATINEGVVLDVTPQISADGIITMNIHPTITERTGQATSPDGNTVPIVDVRETDTVLRVREGETVFIAGLISDRTIENETKIPLIGSIPIVGNLFKKTTQETRKTDMVILLSPTITTLQTAADYARERLEEQGRLRETLN